MSDKSIFEENKLLKEEFRKRNLDPQELYRLPFEDIGQENDFLRDLLAWVEHFEACQSRTLMEIDGFKHPPVYPDYDPDSDWFRFELWIQGKPTSYFLRERLPKSILEVDADELSDDEIESRLSFFIEILSYHDIEVDFYGLIPDRLTFEYLLQEIDEEYDLMAGGTYHLDGCSGFCPDCFQRPWCDQGLNSCWDEDREIGKMAMPDSVQRYVSATPFSLSILEKCQTEDDDDEDGSC